MTDAAESVESRTPLACEPVVRAAKPSTPSRLADPDWVDWCDADR